LKKKKKSYARFYYLDASIARLSFKETEKAKVVSFLLYVDEEIPLYDDDSTQIELKGKEWRYFQEWIVPEMELMRHAPYSKKMEQKFKNGDENALFGFCSNSEYAFRFWWVVEQIEKWRLDNNIESTKKIKKAITAYAFLQGRSQIDELTYCLKRDIEYIDFINNEINKGKSLTIAKNLAARNYCISVKSINYTYKSFEKYRFFERIDNIKSDWRGCAAGFPKNIPLTSDIDTLLEEVFELKTFKKNLIKELDFFKKLRRKIWKIKYKKNDVPLLWDFKPTTLTNINMELFYKEASRFWKSHDEIKNAFNDYINWENLINNEDPLTDHIT